jgi:transcriptional regulator with XRE-family HTH domain
MPLDPCKIRQRRRELGLTQAEAAQLAGMPRPHWTRIELGGRNNPRISTAQRVAKALNWEIDDLRQAMRGENNQLRRIAGD